MKVALYARVSTLNNGQSPEMQLRELREYCGRRGWEISGEYIDIGISGTKDSRPELNRLMADAHKRGFDVVCVWKFDRFARSVSHLLRALETFKSLGIEFCSAQLDCGARACWHTECAGERQKVGTPPGCDYTFSVTSTALTEYLVRCDW